MRHTGWMSDFVSWLGQRPRWLQTAAKYLGASRQLTPKQFDELAALCLKEASDPATLGAVDLSALAFADPTGQQVRLLSVSDVSGLNALNPRGSLELGQAQLTVVYGENGTGKSGYVRILKQVCGSRDRRPIKPNVFKSGPQAQRCTITYEVEGTPTTAEWTPGDGTIEDLREVDIFDTRLGRIVLTEENEVTYEPPVLTFIADLAFVCESIRRGVDADMAGLPSQLPTLPKSEWEATKAGSWYRSLKANTTDDQVGVHCAWTESDELSLKSLTERLNAESPAAVATTLRRKITNLEGVRTRVDTWGNAVSDSACKSVRELREQAGAARAAAGLAAQEAFSDAPFDGVGSELWRALWTHARAYSDAIAYPEHTFPFVGDGSLCVLCMQGLDDPAKQRFRSFEEFVRGAAEEAAQKADVALAKAIDALGESPTEEAVGGLLDAAGVEDSDIREVITSFFADVRHRRRWALAPTSPGPLPTLPDMEEWRGRCDEEIERLTQKASAFDRDAANADHSEIRSDRDELAAKRWVADQEVAIRAEIERLNRRQQLDKARSLTATTGLSKKKGELAEQLVSEAFVDAFGRELRVLAADRIRVELLKTRTERGHTLHRVQLKGLARTDIGEVLSEGEFRVVALAATLADATVGEAQGAFVFDDPISSLDQRFEEAVVRRLVELACDRQVIVFTHRLSLLGLVEEYSRKGGVSTDVRCVTREPWGTGEPTDTPLAAKKPESALKKLKDERLAQAAKALKEDGSTAYLPLAKAICSDYRILLERTVEFVLLADVVQRHRRAIQTLGKLEKLANIESADCDLLDRLMTKYSRYEHSQSIEAPVSLPDPDELEADIDELIDWISGYRKR